MFTSLAFIMALQLDEYYCRLSSFGDGMCVYQCQTVLRGLLGLSLKNKMGAS